MSKQTRIWLVVAILHTFYLFFVLGLGATTPGDLWVVRVFPLGEFTYYGEPDHLGFRDLIHFMFLSVTLVWVIWGWLFVQEGTWREDRIQQVESTDKR